LGFDHWILAFGFSNHRPGFPNMNAPATLSRQTELRVAVLFDRVGPYHFARLKAAGECLRVTVLEHSDQDPVYAWDEVAGQEGFARVTLFKGVSVQQQSAGTIRTRVRRALSELRPAVVAIPGWYDGCALAALQWAVDFAVPAVVMSETTPWDFERKWWKEAIKRQVVRCFAAGLAGGACHAEYLVSLGLDRDRVFLGYDAVDNDYFARGVADVQQRAAEVARERQLPVPYFLASARFIDKKNLPHLLQAYARYRELATRRSASPPPAPWSLVLLGDGPLRPALGAARSGLGLDDYVHLPGFKQYPELPAYYGLAGAFIHASTTEQWGLVVNEAMASGLPVLVSRRCGCAADLVQEGRNGFTFDPGDVEAMAQAMFRLAETPEPRLEEMGAASREIIARWGAPAFAAGLAAAARVARQNSNRPASLISRGVLALATRARGRAAGEELQIDSRPASPL
jgi:glycosyltransferase involved in cell wall biosynthesis